MVKQRLVGSECAGAVRGGRCYWSCCDFPALRGQAAIPISERLYIMQWLGGN